MQHSFLLLLILFNPRLFILLSNTQFYFLSAQNLKLLLMTVFIKALSDKQRGRVDLIACTTNWLQ